MGVEKINCPNCGGPLVYEMWQGRYRCEYCQSTFKDKKDHNADGMHSKIPRPELKLEDLEELITPLENFVDEVGKGFTAFAKAAAVAGLVVFGIIVTIIILCIIFLA